MALNPIFWVKTGLAALPALAGLAGAGAAEKRTRELGKKNVELINLQTREEIRRLEDTQEGIVGTTKATIAASGFAATGDGGSSSNFLSNMEQEFKNQRDWMVMVGARKEEIAALDTDLRADAIGTQARSAALTAVTTAVGSIGSEMNWWNK